MRNYRITHLRIYKINVFEYRENVTPKQCVMHCIVQNLAQQQSKRKREYIQFDFQSI